MFAAMKPFPEYRARTGWSADGPGFGALGFGSRVLGIFARLGCCGDEDAVVSLLFVLDTRHGSGKRGGSAHSQYLRFTSPNAPGVLLDAMVGRYSDIWELVEWR